MASKYRTGQTVSDAFSAFLGCGRGVSGGASTHDARLHVRPAHQRGAWNPCGALCSSCLPVVRHPSRLSPLTIPTSPHERGVGPPPNQMWYIRLPQLCPGLPLSCMRAADSARISRHPQGLCSGGEAPLVCAHTLNKTPPHYWKTTRDPDRGDRRRDKEGGVGRGYRPAGQGMDHVDCSLCLSVGAHSKHLEPASLVCDGWQMIHVLGMEQGQHALEGMCMEGIKRLTGR